ncbi:hypothetical protein BH23GEM6_BH23GEM6_21110 [soil metagenome]
MMQGGQQRPRAVAAILIICAVILGAIGGITFDRLVLLPRAGYAGEVTPAPTEPREWQRDQPGATRTGQQPGSRPSAERYLQHLEEELALTEEQRLRLGEILGNQQERVMEITRESRPRIRAVAEDTREAIREVLTPAQWERFQEMRQQRDRRNGSHGSRGQSHRSGDSVPSAASRPAN